MRRTLLMAGALSLFGAAVMMRAQAMPPVRSGVLDDAVGKSITLEGVVDNEPDVRENTQHLVVAIQEPYSTKVLVHVARYESFAYGDTVRVQGKLRLPEPFGEDGRMFDYPHFLAKDGIGYEMSFAKVSKTGHGQGNPVWSALYSLKNTYTYGIGMALPEPAAGLGAGITAGDKRAMGGDLLTMFRDAGVIHIVVLSGYNIALVSTAVLFFLGRLSRRLGSGLGAVFIVLFVVATGGSAAAVRAGVMACVALFAYALHRPYHVARALIFAVAAMVLWNPYILLYDPGFQLSVISTIGIMYVSPLFEHYFARLPETLGVRSIMATTIGTQITVLPYLLYSTGNLSLVALPVNLLIVPLVPLAMFCTFVAGIAGIISPALAVFVGFPAYALLSAGITLVEWAVRMPYAAVSVPAFSFAWVVVLYALLFVCYLRLKPASGSL